MPRAVHLGLLLLCINVNTHLGNLYTRNWCFEKYDVFMRWSHTHSLYLPHVTKDLFVLMVMELMWHTGLNQLSSIFQLKAPWKPGRPQPQRQPVEKAQQCLKRVKLWFCWLQLPGAWLLVCVQNSYPTSLNNIYFSDHSCCFWKRSRARRAHIDAIFFPFSRPSSWASSWMANVSWRRPVDSDAAFLPGWGHGWHQAISFTWAQYN